MVDGLRLNADINDALTAVRSVRPELNQLPDGTVIKLLLWERIVQIVDKKTETPQPLHNASIPQHLLKEYFDFDVFDDNELGYKESSLIS
jgi:hypothetical protein